MTVIQDVVFGIINGSYVAIAAIGFTLVYKIIDMINFAHGDFMTIGGYVGVLAATQFSIPIPVAIPIAIVIAGTIGWGLARVVFRPLKTTGPIPLLLASIGLGMILRNGIRLVAGSRNIFLEAQNAKVYRFETLGFYINTQQILIILLSIASFAAMHLLLTRTRIGIGMRAMGDSTSLAQISGIDTSRIRDYVWILSAGLAGLAGYMFAIQSGINPTYGFNELLIIIAAAILGGAGSPYGAIVGSYVLSITIAVTIGSLPSWATGLSTGMAFVVLIVVLLVRPGGITGAEVGQ